MSAGIALLEEVILATGLPKHLVQKELRELALRHSYDLNQITLDQLRVIMVDYLQETLLNAKEAFIEN